MSTELTHNLSVRLYWTPQAVFGGFDPFSLILIARIFSGAEQYQKSELVWSTAGEKLFQFFDIPVVGLWSASGECFEVIARNSSGAKFQVWHDPVYTPGQEPDYTDVQIALNQWHIVGIA